MNRCHWAITKQQMSIVHEITSYSKAIKNRQKPNIGNDEKDNNFLRLTYLYHDRGGEQLVKKAEI